MYEASICEKQNETLRAALEREILSPLLGSLIDSVHLHRAFSRKSGGQNLLVLWQKKLPWGIPRTGPICF